jgi:hypothetical protein
VLDRARLDAAADAVDDVLPQPARLLDRMGGDDHLVHRRLQLGDRVACRGDRIRFHDEAVGRNPLFAERRERPI